MEWLKAPMPERSAGGLDAEDRREEERVRRKVKTDVWREWFRFGRLAGL
jgi:hypothetical protein